MEDMGVCAGELTCTVSKSLFLESSSAFTLEQLVVLTFNKGKKQKKKKQCLSDLALLYKFKEVCSLTNQW